MVMKEEEAYTKLKSY